MAARNFEGGGGICPDAFEAQLFLLTHGLSSLVQPRSHSLLRGWLAYSPDFLSAAWSEFGSLDWEGGKIVVIGSERTGCGQVLSIYFQLRPLVACCYFRSSQTSSFRIVWLSENSI